MLIACLCQIFFEVFVLSRNFSRQRLMQNYSDANSGLASHFTCSLPVCVRIFSRILSSVEISPNSTPGKIILIPIRVYAISSAANPMFREGVHQHLLRQWSDLLLFRYHAMVNMKKIIKTSYCFASWEDGRMSEVLCRIELLWR